MLFLNLSTTNVENVDKSTVHFKIRLRLWRRLCVLKESSRFLFYFVFTCAVIRKATFFFDGEGRVLSETCCWLFVESVPLLVDKERVQRQLKVETWLNLTQLLKEIQEDDKKNQSHHKPISYVV